MPKIRRSNSLSELYENYKYEDQCDPAELEKEQHEKNMRYSYFGIILLRSVMGEGGFSRLMLINNGLNLLINLGYGLFIIVNKLVAITMISMMINKARISISLSVQYFQPKLLSLPEISLISSLPSDSRNDPPIRLVDETKLVFRSVMLISCKFSDYWTFLWKAN